MAGRAYIVTGGAGFVGSNLVAALLKREPDARIVVVDSLRSGSFANIVEACGRATGAGGGSGGSGGVFTGELHVASDSEVVWQWLIEKVEPAAIFHIGAITDTTVSDETLMIRENVGGFGELLEEAGEKDIPLVYASSAATYGSPPQGVRRVPFPVQAAGKPNNVYGFSKWLMENEHRRFARRQLEKSGREPRVVGLRYFNVFGPGEGRKGKMASMVHQLAVQVIAGQRPRIFEDGSQARDQVYVDDVVSCTLAAAGLGDSASRTTAPAPGIYNLGSGVATSFRDIAAAVREGAGASEKDLPTELFPMPAAIRAFYQDYTCADMTETERGLGWKPAWEPLAAMRAYAGMLAGRG